MKKESTDKTKKIKISIIITVKNAEQYLEVCLDSIKKQTLKEIEIVCIDGESKDNTLDILKKYQKKDSRLVIYTQERPGIGVAKNYGIEKSKGEFITFLDADDYYIDSNALKFMYDAAFEKEVSICGALRSEIKADGNIVPFPLHRTFLIGFPNGRMFYYKNIQYDYHFHSYIYNREMIINSNARFAETRVYDDTHFFIRAMLKAEKFYVIPIELYCYRCHEFYSWNNELAYDALESLIDQLLITKENKLEIGHYITVQRINYEYGEIFKKHIRNGDFKLLKLLIDAQENIDSNLIEKVLNNPLDVNILKPMFISTSEIKKIGNSKELKFVLSSLENLIFTEKEAKYINEYEKIYNSKAYIIGRIIIWLPKKIYKFFHLK